MNANANNLYLLADEMKVWPDGVNAETAVKIMREAADQFEQKEKELQGYKKTLERLSSMEAFEMSRAIHDVSDKELLARIDYARAAIGNPRGGESE